MRRDLPAVELRCADRKPLALELVHQSEALGAERSAIPEGHEVAARPTTGRAGPPLERVHGRVDDCGERPRQARGRELSAGRLDGEEDCERQRDGGQRGPTPGSGSLALRVAEPSADEDGSRPANGDHDQDVDAPCPEDQVVPQDPEDATDRDQTEHERDANHCVEFQERPESETPGHDRGHGEQTEEHRSGNDRADCDVRLRRCRHQRVGDRRDRVEMGQQDFEALHQADRRLRWAPEVVEEHRQVAARRRDLLDDRRDPHQDGNDPCDQQPPRELAERSRVSALLIGAPTCDADRQQTEAAAQPQVRHFGLGTERARQHGDGQEHQVVAEHGPDREEEDEPPEHREVRVPWLGEEHCAVGTEQNRESGRDRQHETEPATPVRDPEEDADRRNL